LTEDLTTITPEILQAHPRNSADAQDVHVPAART
jgi:hypothetical protein